MLRQAVVLNRNFTILFFSILSWAYFFSLRLSDQTVITIIHGYRINAKFLYDNQDKTFIDLLNYMYIYIFSSNVKL